eukprot:SAG31_NODE_4033_length_3648_cov_1.803043_1_plen_47_part_00
MRDVRTMGGQPAQIVGLPMSSPQRPQRLIADGEGASTQRPIGTRRG